MPRATCPVNPEHNRFATSAHVAQTWEVDRDGEFVSVIADCTDVTHRPESGNLWECLDCVDDDATDPALLPVYANVE
jgi:hypothetical protein